MDVSRNPSPTGMRYHPLLRVLAAMCLGILIDCCWPLPVVCWWSAAAGVWLVWLWLWQRQADRSAACVLLVGVAVMGALWHHVWWNVFDRDELGRFARGTPQPVCIRAIALTGVRRSPAPPPDPMNTLPEGDETEITLMITSIRNGAGWIPAAGKVDLTVEGHLLGVRAGDQIRTFARLTKPAPPQNPGQFDFRRYLRTRRQLCWLQVGHPSCVTRISTGSWFSLRRLVYEARDRCDALLWNSIHHQRAGLAAAVLLGAREQIDRQRNEGFFTTGTVHLLAISGLHVGILAYLFWFVARTGWVSRRWAILSTVIFVIVYALLTDARPPVVRATILIVAFCAARLLGRQAFSFNTLAAAAIVILILNPAQLFQTGTQLSFLAVATLACCGPLLIPRRIEDPLDRLIAQTRTWPTRIAQRFGETVFRIWLTSTCIWLVALPLVLYRFHLVSPVAIFLNPLLMLPVAVALFSGFGVLVCGWLLPPVGFLFGGLCDWSLWSIELCIQAVRPVPGSHFFLPAPHLWWVIGFYVGMAFFVALPQLRPPRRWSAAIVLLWIALGMISTNLSTGSLQRDNRHLHCTFVAVGHGTGVVLELPGGQTLLYDAGRLGSPHVAAHAVTNFLWSRGVTHLDAVIISHADADHYNALPEILGRVSVGVVYVSPVMSAEMAARDATERKERNPLDHRVSALPPLASGVAALREAIENRGVPIRELSMGDRFNTSGGVTIEVLHPPARGVLGSDNANSIVLQIDYAGRRILLPGDLESPGMEDVLAEQPLDCDAVMAPHHGSARSNPSGFAAWSTPQWVVISGGHRDELGAVIASFQAAGARVLHTADVGAVRITVDERDLLVRSWRQQPWK